MLASYSHFANCVFGNMDRIMLSKHGDRKNIKTVPSYSWNLFLWTLQDAWILCRNVRQFKTFSAFRNWNDSRRCSWWFFISLDCNLWIALQQGWWRSEQLEWSALFCELRVNCIFSVWTRPDELGPATSRPHHQSSGGFQCLTIVLSEWLKYTRASARHQDRFWSISSPRHQQSDQSSSSVDIFWKVPSSCLSQINPHTTAT